MSNLIFLLLLFKFNIANISTNSLKKKKEDWYHQSNKYVANFKNRGTEVFYGTSPWKNIVPKIKHSSPDSIQKGDVELL